MLPDIGQYRCLEYIQFFKKKTLTCGRVCDYSVEKYARLDSVQIMFMLTALTRFNMILSLLSVVSIAAMVLEIVFSHLLEVICINCSSVEFKPSTLTHLVNAGLKNGTGHSICGSGYEILVKTNSSCWGYQMPPPPFVRTFEYCLRLLPENVVPSCHGGIENQKRSVWIRRVNACDSKLVLISCRTVYKLLN